MSGDMAPSSFLHRLATTPLRDVLRGRLTGRLDMDRVFAGAGLPPTLEALVRSVCRRARLWRSERVEVARELASHFGDGLAAGRTAAELERDFGSPREAAKLIRRAAIRKRPLLWHIRRRTQQAIGVLIVLVVLIYVGFFAWLYLGSPSVKRNYVAEYNATVDAVPMADRAVPLLRQGMLRLTRVPAKIGEYLPALYEGDADWDETLAYVESVQPAIALFREASERPATGMRFGTDEDEQVRRHLQETRGYPYKPVEGGWPVDPANPPLLAVTMSELSWVRNAVRHLMLDLHVAIARRDGARAMEDLRSMMNWSALLMGHKVLNGQLVGLSIWALSCNAVLETLTLAPDLLSDEHLADLSDRLGRMRISPASIDLRYERDQFMDVLQRVYTDNGQGDGRITLEGLRFLGVAGTYPGTPVEGVLGAVAAAPLIAMLASRKEMQAEFERNLKYFEPLARTEPWKRTLNQFAPIEEFKNDRAWERRYWPVAMLQTAYDKAVAAADQVSASGEGVRTVIALHQYRRRTGRWPATLDALVPGLLPRVPVDVMDGQALRYRVSGNSMVLYSIGTDRKDDGGKPPERGGYAGRLLPVGRAPERSNEGDWVFWPYEIVRPERK